MRENKFPGFDEIQNGNNWVQFFVMLQICWEEWNAFFFGDDILLNWIQD